MLPSCYDCEVADDSKFPELFGDQLALARLHWVREMSARLEKLGYHDYRRSDAVLLRRLLTGATPLGQLGLALGVTRQGARKMLDGLVGRRLVELQRDPHDARRLLAELTPEGRRYASAVVDVLGALNDELRGAVPSDDLHAASRVLRAVTARFSTVKGAAR